MRISASFLLKTTICGLLASTSGCMAVAAILDKTSDPKEPAKYIPDQDNALILVEDFQNPAVIEMVADHMDQLICEELIANKVVPVVNPEKLTVLRLDHPDDYRAMKIPAIGYKLGARQVIYANITQFSVTSEGGTEVVRGHAEARVRVVDCATGLTRWPSDTTSAGYPITLDVPISASTNDVNGASVREALAKAVATKIARLFYNASIDQPDNAPRYPETDLQ